jgi:hypothetical protein
MRGSEGGLLSNYFFLQYSTICMTLEAFRLTSRVSTATMRPDPVCTPTTTGRTTLRCRASAEFGGARGRRVAGRRCIPRFLALMVDEPCLTYVICLLTQADSLSRHRTSLFYSPARRLLPTHPPLSPATGLLLCMPTAVDSFSVSARHCFAYCCRLTPLSCLYGNRVEGRGRADQRTIGYWYKGIGLVAT